MIMAFIVAGCDDLAVTKESTNKLEYSILQSYEFKYREERNDASYMIFRRALGTDATVIAFPIKDKSKGYVMILAHAGGTPNVKIMPETDFVVTHDSYAALKADVSLSKEVDEFIAAHIR